MRDYSLPCGTPELITDRQEIETKLKEGQEGFVAFHLKSPATIKNNQIPFLPDDNGEIKAKITGRYFLHTKLLKTFCRQYIGKGTLIYKNFWIFTHQKGCVDKFLDYCQELKKEDEKKGKLLANSLYGVLGKNRFSGYHYHPFMLAVNHLAILQTYYLYRQFQPEQVLAIRSDCIYIQGDLPASLLKEKEKYHLEHYKEVSFKGEADIYNYDLNELKSFANGQERTEFIKKFNQ